MSVDNFTFLFYKIVKRVGLVSVSVSGYNVKIGWTWRIFHRLSNCLKNK